MACSNATNVGWDDWIGKRVCIKESLLGTLKYFGETYFGNGLWCGVELDNPSGKNDGMVKGVRYFTCDPNYGMFVPVSKVTKIKHPEAKKNPEFEINLEKTFEIKNCANTFSPVIESVGNSDTYVNLSIDAIELTEQKPLHSKLDSEESLGILNPDIIKDLDSSWESSKIDISIKDIPNSYDSFSSDTDIIKDSVFLSSTVDAINENKLPDIVNEPVYASTPRRKTKFAYSENALGHLSLVLEESEGKQLTFKESFNNLPNIVFDFEKLKNSPNLTSTCNVPLDSNKVLNPNFGSDLPAEYSENMNLQENLNKTHVLPSQYEGLANTNLLNETYEFPKASAASLNNSQHINHEKEMLTRQIISEKNLANQANGCQQLEYGILNATFEIQDANKALKELAIRKNENSLDSKADTNRLDKFKGFNKIPNNSIPSSIKNSALVFEKTFVLDSSPIRICSNTGEQNEIIKASHENSARRESFNHKSKFLKEAAALENKISLPFTRTSLPITSISKISKTTSNHINKSNSTPQKLNKASLNCKNGRLSLENKKVCVLQSTSNTNAPKAIKGIKKPSSSCSPKQSSKIIKVNSVYSKGKGNVVSIPCVQESTIPTKNLSLSNAYLRTDEILNKTRPESNCNDLSKITPKRRYSLKMPNNLNDGKYASKISTYGSKSISLSNVTANFIKKSKYNKENENQIKPTNYQFDIKCETFPVASLQSKESDSSKVSLLSNPRRASVSGCLKKNDSSLKRSSDKLSIPVFKVPVNTSAQNAGKNKSTGGSQRIKLQAQGDFVTEQPTKIARRNSLSICPKEKLPIGIIKPRFSLSKPLQVSNGLIKSEKIDSSEALFNSKQSLPVKGATSSLRKLSTDSPGKISHNLRLPKPSRKSTIATSVSLQQQYPRLTERNNTGQMKIQRFSQRLKNAANSAA